MTDYGNPKTIEDIPCIRMYGKDFRNEILAMHKAITELGLWNEMKEDPGEGGYMFSDKPYINKIIWHDLVRQCGHSGATQAYCMRYMQYIANNGFDDFQKSFSK